MYIILFYTIIAIFYAYFILCIYWLLGIYILMLVYIFLQIEWMCICVAFLTANLFIFVIHSLFVPNNRGGMYTHARHFDNHTQITYGCQQQSDDILTKFT